MPIRCLALPFIFNPSDRGWYSDEGQHVSTNENYSAGFYYGSTAFTEWHNFFTFDLSGLSGNVNSAVFRFYVGNTDNGTHPSTNGFFSIYDVNTALPALLGDSTTDVSIFNDLGTGVNYGSVLIPDYASYSFREITFNSEGISAIYNSLGGSFVFGGAMDNDFRMGGGTGGTNPFVPILTIDITQSVPLPTTLFLILYMLPLVNLTIKNIYL